MAQSSAILTQRSDPTVLAGLRRLIVKTFFLGGGEGGKVSGREKGEGREAPTAKLLWGAMPGGGRNRHPGPTIWKGGKTGWYCHVQWVKGEETSVPGWRVKW